MVIPLLTVQKLVDINFEHLYGLVTLFGHEQTMTRVFAYCRVSTSGQTTDNQIQEIATAGFHVMQMRAITETISGSIAAGERPGFSKLLEKLEAGDVLVVTKLDRLGRNAMDVRQTVEALAKLGVKVHCLALGGVDLTSPAGKMTMAVISAVAEFERDLLIERTQAGLARAKSEGQVLGRPRALKDVQVADALQRLAGGEAVAAVARALKTSRATITRVRDSHAA
jgi:putative DNA-invertase from lambdoid prophage Rac